MKGSRKVKKVDWEVETNDGFPYDEILLYKGQEISLKEVVDLLNNISDIYYTVSELRGQLEKYEKFFKDLKIIMDLPEDTKKALDKVDDKLGALARGESNIEHILYKYNLR